MPPTSPTTLSNHRLRAVVLHVLTLLAAIGFSGCSLLPDIKHKPQYYNPFPQVQTVAVLPFANQSEEPTLSSDRVALAYCNELQAIPGFEVLPLGAVKMKLQEYNRRLECGEDFQAFARYLGVDAVLVGSVTDYAAYYPPRITMKVNWYAANPSFHPILPGYGLPWGTKEEKKIPRWIHQEAQRALAKEQLKTQTPLLEGEGGYQPEVPPTAPTEPEPIQPLMPEDKQAIELNPVSTASWNEPTEVGTGVSVEMAGNVSPGSVGSAESALPTDWPDPRGFQPSGPKPTRPVAVPQFEPIISHMRTYNGHDEDFTQRLADYFYFREDARFGGWQAYLQRSEDFIRVCCHFHIADTLSCRGGEDESRLLLRWPIERFQR